MLSNCLKRIKQVHQIVNYIKLWSNQII